MLMLPMPSFPRHVVMLMLPMPSFPRHVVMLMLPTFSRHVARHVMLMLDWNQLCNFLRSQTHDHASAVLPK
jgi:hypothetical protein